MSLFTLGKARQDGFALLVQKEEKAAANNIFGERSNTNLLDVDCILSYVAKVSKTYIFCHPEAEINENEYKKFLELIENRKKGLPVAYITGKKEFFGYDFIVSPDVLIPKPDTEVLVEKVLEVAEQITFEKNTKVANKAISSERKCLKVADICTGSGCVAIAVAKKLKEKNIEFKMVATDISEKALNIAKENSRLNGCDIEFVLGDLLEPLIKKNDQFDLIISNPPYVPNAVAQELLLDGRNEPILALDGDCGETTDGTGIIRRLSGQLSNVLKKGGFVLMEAGEYNIETVHDVLQEKGFIQLEIFNDLSGMKRVIKGQREN